MCSNMMSDVSPLFLMFFSNTGIWAVEGRVLSVANSMLQLQVVQVAQVSHACSDHTPIPCEHS